MEIKIYNSKQEVAKRFSKFFHDFAKDKAQITVALSGGSTPKIVFEELAGNYRERIAWQHIHFYWGDERCVPPSNEQSNYRMTKQYLLDRIDIPETNIHRIRGENDPHVESTNYAHQIQEHLTTSNGIPQFDLVILGMGEDGHTASVFPHQIDLWDSEKFCEVAQHPDSGQNRITLTGSVINNAKQVVFLVTGEGKSEKFNEILNKQGDYNHYPASLVRPVSGNLIWFLDRDAAALINEV